MVVVVFMAEMPWLLCTVRIHGGSGLGEPITTAGLKTRRGGYGFVAMELRDGLGSELV